MQTTELIHRALNAERDRRGMPVHPGSDFFPAREEGESLSHFIARCREAYGLPAIPTEGLPDYRALSGTEPMRPLAYYSVADATGPHALVAVGSQPEPDYRDPAGWLTVGWGLPDANLHARRAAEAESFARGLADYEAREAAAARRARSAEVPEWHMTRAARVARGYLQGMDDRWIDSGVLAITGVLVRPLPAVTTIPVRLPDGRVVDNYVIAGDSVDRINRVLASINGAGMGKTSTPAAAPGAMQAKAARMVYVGHPDQLDPAPPLNAGADHAGAGDRAVSSVAAKAHPCPTCGAAPGADCVRSGRYRRGSHRARMALSTSAELLAADRASGDAEALDNTGILCTSYSRQFTPDGSNPVKRTFGPTTHHLTGPYIGIRGGSQAERDLGKAFYKDPDGADVAFALRVCQRMMAARDQLEFGQSLSPRHVYESAQRMIDEAKATEPVDRGIVCTGFQKNDPGGRTFAETKLRVYGLCIGLDPESPEFATIMARARNTPGSAEALFDRRVADAMIAARNRMEPGSSLAARSAFEGIERAKMADAERDAATVRIALDLGTLNPGVESIEVPITAAAPPVKAKRITCCRGKGSVGGNWQALEFKPTTLITHGLCIGLERDSVDACVMQHLHNTAPHSPASIFNTAVADKMAKHRDRLALGASLPLRSTFEATQRAVDLMDADKKAYRANQPRVPDDDLIAAFRAAIAAAVADAADQCAA